MKLARSPANPARKPAARQKPGKVRRLTRPEVAEVFARFERAMPEPKGELQYVNPFTLLVAVVLSAQATNAGVNKATPALFALAPTPEKMVDLGVDRVEHLIRTIGLFRTKARNVVALSRKLVEEFGGAVPDTRDALETLPGVGRKTANVVLNMAFGQPTMAVDTHIFRVSNRTGLAPGRDPLGRTRPRKGGAGGIQAPRPPLADPARPLRLQGPQAGMPALHHQRYLQVAGQDGVRRARRNHRR